MITKTHSYKTIYTIVPVLLFIFIFHTAIIPETAFAFVEDTTLKTEINVQDDFDKAFREGRDLIDKENWARAAEKFKDVVAKYPNNKSTDAALYWLAFSYKKQKAYKQAEETLERLIKEFPSSSWADDARVMKMDVAVPLGRVYTTGTSGTVYAPSARGGTYTTVTGTTTVTGASGGTVYATTPSARLIQGQLDKAVVETLYATTKVQLDREDEIKLAAFQSLLVADPKRAIDTTADILSPNSKASETLKQAILRTLRTLRIVRAQAGNYNVYSTSVGKANVPLLRDALVKNYKAEQNVKIRKEMIYTLANIYDDQAAKYLTDLYASESDKEIKIAIINALGGSTQHLYAYNTGFSVAPLPARKVETENLVNILRNEKDAELRRLAFSSLQKIGVGNQPASQSQFSVENLIQLYDGETDEELKASFIRVIGRMDQAQATRKLLDIAKNDKSNKLRLEAIYSLKNSKDPEVINFLQNLIK